MFLIVPPTASPISQSYSGSSVTEDEDYLLSKSAAGANNSKVAVTAEGTTAATAEGARIINQERHETNKGHGLVHNNDDDDDVDDDDDDGADDKDDSEMSLKRQLEVGMALHD
jgi:hypothetical protein